MEDLKAFVKLNVCTSCCFEEKDSEHAGAFKSGIVSLDLLLAITPENEEEESRLRYVTNLCLMHPKPFPISNKLSGLEKACMRLSFGEYEGIDLSMYDFKHELVGSVPTNSGIYENAILIVRCSGTKNGKEHVYTTERYEFGNEIVQSLTVEEQSILLVEMIKIFNTEICQDLRKLKVQAYIDRILFPRNEKSEIVGRTARYYLMALNLEPCELESYYGEIADLTFEHPFVFRNEWEKLLGDAYYSHSAYSKALEYFEKYKCNAKIINCLVKLNRNDEAVERALEEIESIGRPKCLQSKIRLCNMNIVVGTITGKEMYFDAALDAYYSYEPLKAKGIYFLKAGNAGKAIASFEEALRMVPRNTEIQFLYASALTSAERFSEAAAVYERLVADDQKNTVFLRNLAMCRIQLEDIKNGLASLKKASMYDQNVMHAYFLMSIKYNLPKEIRYSLERVDFFEDLEDAVMYLVGNKVLSKDEVKSALKRNNRITSMAESLIEKIDSSQS
ncbi:hypothetical protein EHEL_031330 [Encephalitozoon hellem ATCC 50504]|uniref:Anaphase-promoting complex subunit Cut9 n=1 Tax=Encephalitozoon hellem TaxID=27973 RepID=A0A9Q9F7Z5_ENCHE|nr:uncharacterized protein EHEL_031330 [Encephalitozoon hellem ATCC 50504]AFM98028.1 hypothetical protein EHEL_031330 [Encephalitozoon hellem ATCC 50504]UTX42833.1 anaphase-promoting complex subunit Cut9 [Encephalitozoon hellem]|eukprot:XP_003887009.1 hypothetical protein EHEL_031330 [Encephalitozoon hellem ATCC 50504]